uniref:Transmembrane protein 138 n=2 Tax=Neognathae TaxID=8825 RepID=A0A8B9UCM4_9AVES
MLQTSNYSLVLFLQFLLLFYDLFVNSFSELLRTAPAVQLILFIIQDIAILFNVIIIFLMFFNTFVFQAGLVNLLFHKFKGTILLSAAYLALSISFHVWVMNLRWRDSGRFVWTEGLQTLFVFQRLGKGSRRLGQQEQRGRLGAPGGRVGTPGPSGCDPKRPPLTSFPLSVPQRPCSTATSTSGRRCTWATPSSTRTLSGCARSLLTSAADGAAPACPSATPLPEGRIPEAGGAGPGPSAVLFVLPASRPAAGAGAAHADGRDQQDAGVSWSAPASQPLVGLGCFCG